jgi:hypothetical protein
VQASAKETKVTTHVGASTSETKLETKEMAYVEASAAETKVEKKHNEKALS